MKTSDKAWLAGFIDGEGCIGIQRLKAHNRYWYNVRIQITQTNRTVLEHVQQITGAGVINVLHRASANQSAAWCWQTDMTGALPILKAVKPYLHLKAPHATLALSFAEFWYSNRPPKKQRGQPAADIDYTKFEYFKEQMHTLNARGKERDKPAPQRRLRRSGGTPNT